MKVLSCSNFKGSLKCLLSYVGTLFFRGGQFAHPRKFLGGGWVRMGAQTEKIKEGGLGCANRVRKGFLGGVGCARVRITEFFFFASSSSFLKETLINGC